MPSSIPHQKFCFYHLPTRGRAGIKLGDAWYVSNVSIIFDCSMLLYILFWMFNGLYYTLLYFFGTNLLTQGPVQIAVFCLFQCFAEKEYQMEWNLRESYFWNKRDPEDLEWTSRNQRGGHEARLPPWARPPPLWAPRSSTDLLLPPIYIHIPRKHPGAE